MKTITSKLTVLLMLATVVMATFTIQSCSKKSSGSSTPPVTLIGGYASSDSVAASNLVLYWNFDNSVSEKELGLTPASSSGVTYTTGIRGQAYQGGSGVSAIFAVPSADQSKLNLGSYSISFWYNMSTQQPSGDPGGVFFLSGTQTGDWNELIYEFEPYSPVSGDSVSFHNGFNNIGAPAGAYAAFTMQAWDTLGTGAWTFVTCTYDGPSSTYIVYEDATPIQNASAWGFQTSNIIYQQSSTTGPVEGALNWSADLPDSITIGQWPADNSYGVSTTGGHSCYMGQLDELRLFNRALKQSEVTGLYLNGLAGR
jgi:hypothetical protein